MRVEDADVFAATHALLLNLVAEGLIQGLRIDHPDGLADPRGYLERLAVTTGGAWVVAEKILSGPEQLPADWACAGTTGYDSLNMVSGLFVDQAGADPLTETYQRFAGGASSFAPVALDAKRETAARDLAAEVSRVCRLIGRGVPAWLAAVEPAELRALVVELLAAFPVYRAYVVSGEPPSPVTTAIIRQATEAARRHVPARLHGALEAVCGLVLDGPPELAVAFQQTCGPVMAKGVEDTAFYRWSRLVALNEVGGDPDRFGLAPEEFHAFAGRLARDWPTGLTTLSTHDTKRQEDVRARLAVLAELPQEWNGAVTGWHSRAAELARGQVPEPATEYLLWQTLVGAWPIDRDRVAAYLVKAMREAKTRTSWTAIDEEYESKATRFAAPILHDEQLRQQIGSFVAGIADLGRANALGAKLVQLTMPGVADLFQGCELAGLSLVDPDNRRSVDFARRRELLAAQDAGGTHSGLDADKLLVTSTALRLRRAHPAWFAGHYRPLPAVGPAAAHALSFSRGFMTTGGAAITVVTRLPAGLRRRGGWADTALPLPGGGWRDLLTGTVHPEQRPLLSRLTERFPVALLEPA